MVAEASRSAARTRIVILALHRHLERRGRVREIRGSTHLALFLLGAAAYAQTGYTFKEFNAYGSSNELCQVVDPRISSNASRRSK